MSVDKEALRRKYREERDKRLRPDGNDQYLQLDRPVRVATSTTRTPRRTEREPKIDHVTVAFIGGGFAGLVTGARLKEAGRRRRAHHREGRRLRRHLVLEPLPGRAVRHRGVRLHAAARRDRPHADGEVRARRPRSSSTAGASASSSACTTTRCSTPRSPTSSGTTSRSRWIVRTDRGDEFTARFVAMGTGPLHVPKLPGIPGIETFAGHSFHTSRWDYDYTGGDPAGAPMDRLADKRVAHHRHRRDRGAVRPAPGARRARSCTSSSARRRRSTCATTGRPTREWFAEIASPAGSSAG